MWEKLFNNLRWLVCLLLTIPCISHAADTPAVSAEDEATYNSCVQSWITGLSKNHPEVSQIDIKYISAYYCTCGFQLADSLSSSLDTTEKAKQTFITCLPYAILRNTLHYDMEGPNGERKPAGADALNRACNLAYPRDVNSSDEVAKIAAFCNCAAQPLAAIQEEKGQLTEDVIAQKVSSLAEKCVNP